MALTIYPGRHLFAGVIFAIYFVGQASVAAAEPASERTEKPELRPSLDASDTKKDEKGKSSSSGGFEISVTVPFGYTNRATIGDIDRGGAAKGDFHAFPDATLKWSNQLSFIKMSAALEVATDQYLHEWDAASHSLAWSGKAQFTDGKSDLFIPYVSYKSTTILDQEVRYVDFAVHDAAIGFSSATGFNPNGDIVAYSDASTQDSRTLTLDLKAGRRLAELTELQHWFIQGSFEAAWLPQGDLTLSVEPKFHVRWYEDYYGDRRRDVRVGATAKAVWTPAWLKTILPRSELNFAYSLQRNISNIAEKNYTLWDIGPTATMKWKF